MGILCMEPIVPGIGPDHPLGPKRGSILYTWISLVPTFWKLGDWRANSASQWFSPIQVGLC